MNNDMEMIYSKNNQKCKVTYDYDSEEGYLVITIEDMVNIGESESYSYVKDSFDNINQVVLDWFIAGENLEKEENSAIFEGLPEEYKEDSRISSILDEIPIEAQEDFEDDYWLTNNCGEVINTIRILLTELICQV